MSLLANASITIEFSPLWIGILVGAILGPILIYKGVKLVTRQPRFGSLFIVLTILASVFGCVVLSDLGHLENIMETIKKPGVFAVIGAGIASLVWALGLLIYGTDFFQEKWKGYVNMGVLFTITGIMGLSGLGAALDFLGSMPATQVFVQVLCGIVTGVSALGLFICTVPSE